jgi:hypothetical protein
MRSISSSTAAGCRPAAAEAPAGCGGGLADAPSMEVVLARELTDWHASMDSTSSEPMSRCSSGALGAGEQAGSAAGHSMLVFDIAGTFEAPVQLLGSSRDSTPAGGSQGITPEASAFAAAATAVLAAGRLGQQHPRLPALQLPPADAPASSAPGPAGLDASWLVSPGPNGCYTGSRGLRELQLQLLAAQQVQDAQRLHLAWQQEAEVAASRRGTGEALAAGRRRTAERRTTADGMVDCSTPSLNCQVGYLGRGKEEGRIAGSCGVHGRLPAMSAHAAPMPYLAGLVVVCGCKGAVMVD